MGAKSGWAAMKCSFKADHGTDKHGAGQPAEDD
jgi:hypothetical protein